jgi:MSHA biogenesis protein MshI
MGLFARARKQEGWLAAAFGSDGVSAAIVTRVAEGKPVVRGVAFQPAARPADADALEKLGRQLQAPSWHCTTVLAAGDYQLLSLEAPAVPREELKTAVGWRLKDMLDFPLADATIDVFDIPGDPNGTQRGSSVFAVAARNAAVARRQALYADCKIGLSVIDIPEMAQRNIAALLETPGRGLAMLSFDADGGLLTLSHNGELYQARRIDVKLAQLLEADASAFYDRITLELQRSFDHFDRQFHFISVARLMLVAGGAHGLPGYLADNLYMPVELLDLASVFDFAATPELQDAAIQARYFQVLGAALRDEGKAA